MSNVIRNDHLWTDAEVAYQQARGLHKQVAANHALYGKGGQRDGIDDATPEPQHETLQLDKDIYEFVIALDVQQLQAKLQELKLTSRGNEQELRANLAQALQKARDDSSDQ